MGNITSTIRNEEDYQLDQHPRPALDQISEYKIDAVRKPAGWTHDKVKVDRRVKRWKQKRKYDSKAYEFLTSRSLINSNPDSPPWEATELLGAGSFGVVGLWQQLDPNGKVLDSVAIKETSDAVPRGFVEIFDRRGGKEPIPSEALWMDFLSRRTPYIPNLRQMVHYWGDAKRWRFYMEYCPNGTLTDLITVYKDFNSSHPKSDEQVIPEPYVWFVFYALAQALQAMDLPEGTGMWIDRDLRHSVPAGNRYILHLDMKDDNTLLGRSSTLRDLQHYPPAKMADYGLAQLTSMKHSDNSKRWGKCGTAVWMPPEQYDNGHLDYRWRSDAIHPRKDSNYPYDQRHGVWQIAATVYGMVALDTHNSELYRFVEDIVHDSNGEEKVLDRGLSLLKGRTTSIRKDYSNQLVKTLDRCLNLCPDKRPFPDRLIKICEDALTDLGEAFDRKQLPKPPVFYGSNGVHELSDHVKRRKRSETPPPRRRRLSDAHENGGGGRRR